jgi:twitching motility protein PilT
VAAVDSILSKVSSLGASDVHISVGSPLIIRQYGQLRRARSPEYTPEQTAQLLFEILTPAQKAEFEENMEVDFAYEIPGVGRFRGNAFRQRKGVDLCFRIIRASIPTFADLGIPDVMKKICDHHQGLVLVTGAAGSGKSTTLAAMVDLINSTRPYHVLTIEDPIELVHPVKMGAVNQRQINSHTRSYGNALRAALREDPNVIMVGELRDLETITLAISASETGHLVIGSMNTSSAHKTVDRIIDSYPAGQQNQIRSMLGESLRAIFTQRLVPKADNSGMVLAHELLVGTRQLANLIKDAKTFQIPNIMTTGRAQGMRTMDESLLELVRAKTISPETAVRNATNLKLFAQWAPKEALAAQAQAAPAEAPPAASGAKPGLLGGLRNRLGGGE